MLKNNKGDLQIVIKNDKIEFDSRLSSEGINNNKSKQNQEFNKILINSKTKEGRILKQLDDVQLSFYERTLSSPFNIILKKEYVINVWKKQLLGSFELLSQKRKKSSLKIA